MKQFFFLFMMMLIMSCSKDSRQDHNSRLPNIIHIFADDLGYGDLGCFGARDIKTPNIDRIARDGIKFTDFYSASSVCSPSRSALLCGRMPQRMGINNVFFPESFTGMSPDEITIAELLKKKKYTSGIVGKWHLGHHYQYLPLQQGFDTYFGIPYSNDMSSVVYMRDNEVESYKVDQRYTTKTYTEEAIQFIEENKSKSFFLYIAHNMPHVPIYASEAFLGTSDRGLYGDVIQELDWSVGQVLNKLEKEDLLDNTLIIFSSDNGPWLVMKEHGGSAGNLREGKQYTFDGGMRVPTVAMWKSKIPEGSTYSGMCSQMDWFPTIARLTGIPIPKDRVIDGSDISSVLLNEGIRPDSSLLFLDGSKLECYRKGSWKVKLPFDGYKGSPWKSAVAAHDTLLFNLVSDPGEKTNLYTKHPEKAKLLIKEMKHMHKAMGDLPPSLMVSSAADESHFDAIKNNDHVILPD
jgi:arylsulfatase A-like enzyme